MPLSPTKLAVWWKLQRAALEQQMHGSYIHLQPCHRAMWALVDLPCCALSDPVDCQHLSSRGLELFPAKSAAHEVLQLSHHLGVGENQSQSLGRMARGPSRALKVPLLHSLSEQRRMVSDHCPRLPFFLL